MHGSPNSLDELLQNESFVAYLRREPGANYSYWQGWLSERPHLAAEIADSQALFLRWQHDEPSQALPAERIEQLWQELSERL